MLGSSIWGPPDAATATEFEEFSHSYPKSVFENIAVGWEKLSTGVLVDRILQKKQERIPAMFTRMSDGEGNILALNEKYKVGERLLDYCARRISYIHFGEEKVVPGGLDFFRKMMIDAISSADVSGGPDISGVIRAFDVPDEQKDVRAIVGNRISALAVNERNSKRYVSAWFSRDLLPHYKGILGGEDAVTLISVYDELPSLMEKAFGIGRVVHIPVPIQAVFVPTRERKDTGHYPDAMNRILDAIRPSYQGQIFIVAAGLLAKRYCTEIKRRGGIAIDVGSIAEVWLGKQARGMREDFISKWKLSATD